MTWTLDQATGDLVWAGAEQGIAASPHKGTANLQNVNIATESGEVMCSFSRAIQSQANDATSHTLDPLDTSHLSTSFALLNGQWISISASTISGLSTGNYYVQNSNATPSGTSASTLQLSSYYNSAVISGLGATGTATFTLLRNMGAPIAKATEQYSNGTQQYRYYVLDVNGLVWVYDTARVDAGVTGKIYWFLPDYAINYYGTATPSGMEVFNGWLFVFAGNTIWCKPTVNLGNTTANTSTFASFASGLMMSTLTSTNPHFALSGHQGELYYCDGNYLGSIFANSALLGGGPNIQSYASYTTSTTTGTISTLIGGSIPYGAVNANGVPAFFFPSSGGANPTALTVGTIYYLKFSPGAGVAGTFQVFAAASGGSALDITTGASGTLYFNTFYPVSAGGEATITFTKQRLNLPFFEISQSLVEIGNLVLVGCHSSIVYPWNQVDPTPVDLIQLPENDVHYMIAVNNMGYIFAGRKGNIYITNGSTASAAISVPDYTAGIAGTPASYIEPYFTWGGADYIRGRVYFSIQDQTATKAGNCGGIWSFVPTQNLFFGEDQGLSLRMENTNSYGTLNGVANLIIAGQQSAIGVQYFTAWTSDSVTNPTYGIDASGTAPATTAIIETDALPSGTYLNKRSFAQQEYKLATPLLSGESIQLSYRLNLTDAWTTCGTIIAEASSFSGYCTAAFQNTQWLQLQARLVPNGSSTFSGNRLTELRLR